MLDSNGHDRAMPNSPLIRAEAPDLDNPLDALLGYQLRRASSAFLADLTLALAEFELKPTEASVLLLIAQNPGITQSDIGRVLAIKRANMAPIAALLSARGSIDRDPADGRSQGLRLTDPGHTLAQNVRRKIDAHEARFLPDLPPAERSALIALLKSVWSR